MKIDEYLRIPGWTTRTPRRRSMSRPVSSSESSRACELSVTPMLIPIRRTGATGRVEATDRSSRQLLRPIQQLNARQPLTTPCPSLMQLQVFPIHRRLTLPPCPNLTTRPHRRSRQRRLILTSSSITPRHRTTLNRWLLPPAAITPQQSGRLTDDLSPSTPSQQQQLKQLTRPALLVQLGFQHRPQPIPLGFDYVI